MFGVNYSWGTLELRAGSRISGNASSHGAGVSFVNGSLVMIGGEISGNTATNGYGGGVYAGNGTFTMTGGKISGNTASSYGYGGGVHFENGRFTKTGGVIYGDTDTTHSPGETANTAESGNGHALRVGSMHRSDVGTAHRNADIGSAQNLTISATYDAVNNANIYTCTPVITDAFWAN